MKYKKGDVLICSTDKAYGIEQNLIIGDKCKILNIIELSEKTILDLVHINTNCRVGLFDSICFIPLNIWREFQLRKILK